jgi:hypothetical protein
VRTYSLPRSILGLCSDFLGSKWGAMSASQLG